MAAYYNEHDSFAAAWLRRLIAAGAIAPGQVDERSIHDVQPADLDGFDECHFFAGIGGWPLALRLAGWDDRRPVWTGSCPCQPFSSAGRGAGMADERHLWPVFRDLIRACRPGIVFGEQVASAAVVGGARKVAEPAWIDVVFADLETAHYACGAADVPAAGVGAPHQRQRLWWVGVADAAEPGRSGRAPRDAGADGRSASEPRRLRDAGELAHTCGARLEGRDARSLGHEREAAERDGALGRVGDSEGDRKRRPWVHEKGLRRQGSPRGSSPWSNVEYLPCRDGKARPTQPGLFPLAHGVSGRVGLLRGAGNAIVPQVAAAFVEAVQSVLDSGL